MLDDADWRLIAQVLIRWAIQNGTSVIPKATGVSHIQGNLEALDFELSKDEFEVSCSFLCDCLCPFNLLVGSVLLWRCVCLDAACLSCSEPSFCLGVQTSGVDPCLMPAAGTVGNLCCC